MKTSSIGIENLCVPCACRCRYCLLSWDGRVPGVEYARGERFARRFMEELKQIRPEVRTFFYIGCSMETPRLSDYIARSRKTDSPSAEFLQLNGLADRDDAGAERFMSSVADAGIKTVDFTLYGLREYHDRFAGRKGDFDLLLRLLRAAKRTGIAPRVSLPILRENMGEAGPLLELLKEYGPESYFAFLPHCKGRGAALEPLRLTREEFDALPNTVRDCFSPRVEYRTEGEWVRASSWPEPESRVLTLSLTPENIVRLEGTPAEDIAAALERMDDEYYGIMPSPAELAEMYGDPESRKMYRLRDLLLLWRRRFYAEHGSSVPDMDDERGCFSVRT